MDAAAMTAGPVRKRTAIEKAAIEFPQAIILGCNAMNRPARSTQSLLWFRRNSSDQIQRDLTVKKVVAMHMEITYQD